MPEEKRAERNVDGSQTYGRVVVVCGCDVCDDDEREKKRWSRLSNGDSSSAVQKLSCFRGKKEEEKEKELV